MSATGGDPPSVRSQTTRKLGLLGSLYLVQGLPFGFQVTALPLLLRQRGVSLIGIGLAHALALPWMLKPLWAPLVDRYRGGPFGPRRSWIMPLQLALAVSCASGSWLSHQSLAGLMALVLAMNLLTATMDIAVDGLAIDLLRPQELGYGNIAQVVGYKLGMLTGGGLLVWASARIGWSGLFWSMAGMVVASIVPLALYDERSDPAAGDASPRQTIALRAVLRVLADWLRSAGARWLVLFVATYKLGESISDAMFKPFLYDTGFSRAEIGLWVGSWGMVFSLLGSVAGGALASRRPLLSAVGTTAALRTVPLAGQWWLALGIPQPQQVIAITCAEHFFGGALTTAMFAYMMSRVDRRIGATHYTALAAIEVLGKSPGGWASGLVAESGGYALTFGLATVLSAAFLVLLWPLRRTSER